MHMNLLLNICARMPTAIMSLPSWLIVLAKTVFQVMVHSPVYPMPVQTKTTFSYFLSQQAIPIYHIENVLCDTYSIVKVQLGI